MKRGTWRQQDPRRGNKTPRKPSELANDMHVVPHSAIFKSVSQQAATKSSLLSFNWKGWPIRATTVVLITHAVPDNVSYNYTHNKFRN